MSHSKDPFYRYKILILGESNVGKTSILYRFTEGIFKYTLMNTIGIDFVSKDIKVEDKDVRLQIWDTAGQERFHSITRSYYRNANGILLVFDLTDPRSFDCVDKWYEEIVEEVGNGIPIFLVGNKRDMLDGVDFEDVFTAYSEKAEIKKIKFFITSAKSGDNIDEVFYEMAKCLMNKRSKCINERVTFVKNEYRKRGCC
ncbi:small GTP-binding protein [Hamiltosporidium tvaerminnensis]|uniref:Small GTP-binding protein n=1 Tax=Hamiltosporidium tvaerminnensis TaxID=1176355 RepID=A0A4Q9M1W6_9MICR|nr:Ras- protein Rab-10 [Hamiltosporidium tvaerminnensis]TBU04011.1 small GTP-binding protein [Hamiltosporidium tvaerminnensis]TBU20137.1 small GTP-binding protein [Hamiltosporidium tvaerminnensis]